MNWLVGWELLFEPEPLVMPVNPLVAPVNPLDAAVKV
jgi:hypothetical protein